MSAYYNENAPYPAQWLRNLVAAGHIADGNVLESYLAMNNTLESYLAMKANMKSGARTAITALSQQAQLVDSGPELSGSPAPTGSGGQLNPDFSRWLIGLPDEWASCAPTAMRSSRRSRRRSSEP